LSELPLHSVRYNKALLKIKEDNNSLIEKFFSNVTEVKVKSKMIFIELMLKLNIFYEKILPSPETKDFYLIIQELTGLAEAE